MAGMYRKSWGSHFALVGVSMAGSFLLPHQALAVCVPSPATSNSTITCSGETTTGVGTGAETGVTVTIASGGSIEVAGFGIPVNLAGNAHVVNNGYLFGNRGIMVDAGSLIENMAGAVIEGDAFGIWAEGPTTIENKGEIIGGVAPAVQMTGGSLTNDGKISSGLGYSITAQGGTKIVNNGTLIGTVQGDIDLKNDGLIQAAPTGNEDIYGVAGGGKFVNNKSLIVEGAVGSVGVSFGGTIVNNGNITVDGTVVGVGIDAGESKVENTGDIEVTGGKLAAGVSLGTQSSLDNSGTIKVEAPDSAIGIRLVGAADPVVVKNSGTIRATTAISGRNDFTQQTAPTLDLTNSGVIEGDIELNDKSDRIRNAPGGKIVGDIDMGAGADVVMNAGSIVGAIDLGDGDDLYLIDVSGGSHSGGALTGGQGYDSAGFYVNGIEEGVLTLTDGFEGAAVYVEQDAVFHIAVGSGASKDIIVDLFGTGLVVNDADLTGNGSHVGAVRMIDNDLTFQNADKGAVLSSVELLGSGQSFINDGAIVSDDTGVISAKHAVDNKIRNNGTIKAEADGIRILERDLLVKAYVDNLGVIKAGDNGIETTGETFVENLKGGSITAVNDGVSAGSYSVVVNRGSITSEQGSGIKAVQVNDILNAGTITANGAVGIGINVSNSSVANNNGDEYQGIANTGSIVSRGAGIAGGKFGVIYNSGDITSQTTGVDVEENFFVWNTGKIVGTEVGVQMGIGNQLLNEGTIQSDGVALVLIEENSSDLSYMHEYETDHLGQPGAINEGRIISKLDGVALQNGNRLDNRNTIEAGRDGIVVTAFDAGGAKVANVINNSGLVDAGRDAISIAQGDTTIENSGTLRGVHAIKGGEGAETVVNSGKIEGDIALGGGNDSIGFDLGSVVKGDIDGGGGTDTISTYRDSSLEGSVTGVEYLLVGANELFANFTGPSSIGQTQVQGGTLYVNGSVTTPVTVSFGARLGGGGTIVGDVKNAGTLAPGNSIGTFGITGNYIQSATGQMMVELGNGSSDRLAVTGVATLDGLLTTSLMGPNYAALEGKSYTVLTAGSITGGFDNLGAVQQGFWTLAISESGGAVTVTVTDVNVPLGATVPITGTLGGVVAATLPDSSLAGGIEVTGGGMPPHFGVITGENTPPGSDQQATSLSYDSMGDWETRAAIVSGAWNDPGPRTPAGAMPKTGTAAFEGTTKGELTETNSPDAFVVEGNVLLTANFASGLVNADFTDMEKIDSHGVTSAWIDFRARMSIADGTSEFAGTAGTDDGVWNGEAKGGFYGDEDGMPGRAAGLWSMSSPFGRALGGFMAKRK